MTALPSPMAYKQVDGRMVAEAGPVAIEGVLHRVEHGFVVCNRSLNGRAWNVTMFFSTCSVCYPEAKDCRIHRYSIQGELFEEYA